MTSRSTEVSSERPRASQVPPPQGTTSAATQPRQHRRSAEPQQGAERQCSRPQLRGPAAGPSRFEAHMALTVRIHFSAPASSVKALSTISSPAGQLAMTNQAPAADAWDLNVGRISLVKKDSDHLRA
jgi:hypothetical protein